MLETDIETLRTSTVIILNGFLSYAGWMAMVLLLIELVRKFLSRDSGIDTVRKRLWLSIVGMKAPATYMVSGFLLIYFAYAIINFLAGWFAFSCPSGQPFTTPFLIWAQEWAGLSGIVSACALVFSGFSIAISLGRSKYLLSLAKLLAIVAFFLFFMGAALTCNLPQG